MSDSIQISRTGLQIISFQLEGLCSALRLSVSSGSKHGPGAVAILAKLIKDFKAIVTGKCVEDLPDPSVISPPADLLALAETVRATVFSFLTPDERINQRAAIGFHA